MHSIIYTPIRAPLLVPCIAAFQDTSATVASLNSPAAYRAICRDAISPPSPHTRPFVVLALANEQPAGILIAVLGWQAYWRGFFRRHPLMAAQVVTGRLARRMRRDVRVDAPDPPPFPSSDQYSWADNGPGIAKTVFVGVKPPMRGRGLGSGLYDALVADLRRFGVTRLDAHIDPSNASSLRLHQKADFTLYAATPTAVLGVRHLAAPEEAPCSPRNA